MTYQVIDSFSEQVYSELAAKEAAAQQKADAQMLCKQLIEALGDGDLLNRVYDEQLARATFVGHKNYVWHELVTSVTLHVRSDYWRDNLDGARDNIVLYHFEQGCYAERYRGWRRKMVLVDRTEPRRTLTLRWRTDTAAWYAESCSGWRDQTTTRFIRPGARGRGIIGTSR